MRIVPIRVFLAGVATAAAIAGCGAPAAFHSSLPPTATSSARHSSGAVAAATAPGTQIDGDAALADAVTAAHRAITGSAPYGVYAGHFVPARPAPGRPGNYLVDGEVVPAPPNDAPPNAASVLPTSPQAGATPAGCIKWSGDIPPSCTQSGPFRRVYSDAGYSFALAHVTLPLVTTMPTGLHPVDGSTGFVYFEGWPGAGTSNSEFGFQYSATYQNYFLYAKTSNPPVDFIFVLNGKTVRYDPGPVTLALAGYTIGGQSYLHVAAIGAANFACGTSAGQAVTTCLAHDHMPDGGWKPSSCCIMARMTTIGQSQPTYEFYDGSLFGPVTWSGAELAPDAPTPAPHSTTLPLTGGEPPWSGGGTQDWPPPNEQWPDALARVVASGVSDTGETDTINLTIPPLKMSMSPSSCQYVAKTGTIPYSISMSGSSYGIKIDYGWLIGDFGGLPLVLTIPQPLGNIGDVQIGSTPDAKVNIYGKTAFGGYATDMYGWLTFVDALGNQRVYPTDGTRAEIAVGNQHC